VELYSSRHRKDAGTSHTISFLAGVQETILPLWLTKQSEDSTRGPHSDQGTEQETAILLRRPDSKKTVAKVL